MKVRKIKIPAVNLDQTRAFIELGVLSLSLGAQRASFPSGLEPPLDKVGGTITGPDAYRPLWIHKRRVYENLLYSSEITLIIAYLITKYY